MSTTPSRVLAKDVLMMARIGGMPDTYWHSDSRITRARSELGWTVEQAMVWTNEFHASGIEPEEVVER
jgi:hypothetical protein